MQYHRMGAPQRSLVEKRRAATCSHRAREFPAIAGGEGLAPLFNLVGSFQRIKADSAG